MADNTVAFFWRQLVAKLGGAGVVPGDLANLNLPEAAPSILWGQGTPDGDRAPFPLVNKGALSLAVDQTDDTTPLWVKLDEGNDNADWVEAFLDNAALGGDPIVVRSALFDISAADSEPGIFFHTLGLTLNIRSASLVWNEATGASGAAEGDITIGTATGGAEIVAATAYPVSTASGAVTALTLVATTLADNAEIFASHDVAASAAGTYYLQMVLVVPN